MSLLRTLIKQGKVPLYLDFRTGSLLDKGGMGNDPDPVTNCRWSQSHQGRSLYLQPDGLVTVPDDASLRLSQLSVVSIVRVDAGFTSNSRIIARSDAGLGAINYDFFVSSSQLVLQSLGGGIDSSVLALGSGVAQTASNIGVTWVGGATPRFFLSSSFYGTGSIPVTARSTGAGYDVRVGHILTNYQPQSMAAIVLVNEALSDGDMEQLMSELSITPGVMLRNRTGFSYPGSPRCRLDGRLHRDGSVPCGATQVTNVGDILVPDLWRLVSAGTWDVEELLTGKRIIRGTGVATMVANQHSSGGDGCYGSWLFEVVEGGGQSGYACFGMSTSGPLAGSNGYCVRLTDTTVSLRRIDAGSFTGIGIATPVGLDPNHLYQFWVTRTGAGSFNLWIRGDLFTTWTQLLGPIVDNTHVVGGYTACIADQNAYFGDVVHYDSVMTPSEATVLGILEATFSTL